MKIVWFDLSAGFVDLTRFELGSNAMPVAVDVLRNFPSKHTRTEKLSVTDVASNGFDIAQRRIHGVIVVDRTLGRHCFEAIKPLTECARGQGITADIVLAAPAVEIACKIDALCSRTNRCRCHVANSNDGEDNIMTIDQSTLTKGQIRKLNALRKSIGDDLAETAFSKWLKRQTKASKAPKTDPVAKKIAEALKPYDNDKSFNLGRYGYKVTRSKGRGVKGGFSVSRITD